MDKQMPLPDLPDMMKAGMGLTEALAFWNKMMNTHKHTPEFWWDLLSSGCWKSVFEKEAGRVLH
jgi:hypothetical protein